MVDDFASWELHSSVFARCGHLRHRHDPTLLMFTIAELELVCHSFSADEIELSFKPEPATEVSLRPLLAFIVAIVTPENCPTGAVRPVRAHRPAPDMVSVPLNIP